MPEFTIPEISVNLDYFFALGQLSVPELIWRLFLDGGWVIVVWIAARIWWLRFTAKKQREFASTISYTVLAAQVPKATEQTPMAMEQVFSQLASLHAKFGWWDEKVKGMFNPKISLEIASIDGYIHYYIHTPTKWRDLIEAALYSQYPDAEITETTDYTLKVPEKFPDPLWDVTGLEYVLKKHWAYPIRTYPQFEHSAAEQKFKDPLIGLYEAMNILKGGEQLWIQIVLSPAEDSWVSGAADVVGKFTGKKPAPKSSVLDKTGEAVLAWPAFFVAHATGVDLTGTAAAPVKKEEPKKPELSPGERKAFEAITEKLGKHAFLCKVRVVYVARREVFSKGRLVGIKGVMNQFGSIDMNTFKTYGAVTPKPGGLFDRGLENRLKATLIKAYRGRSGSGATPFILNTEELATLWHFPMLDVKSPSLIKTEAKRSEAPTGLPTADLYVSPRIRSANDEE
jgi:hypothetical protein